VYEGFLHCIREGILAFCVLCWQALMYTTPLHTWISLLLASFLFILSFPVGTVTLTAFGMALVAPSLVFIRSTRRQIVGLFYDGGLVFFQS
jgi:hypothetical protein